MARFFRIANDSGYIHIDINLDYTTGALSSTVIEDLEDKELCAALAKIAGAISKRRGEAVKVLEDGDKVKADQGEQKKVEPDSLTRSIPRTNIPFDPVFTNPPEATDKFPPTPTSKDKRRTRERYDPEMTGV